MSTRGCIIELKKDVCKVGYLHYGANFASKLIHYGMLGLTFTLIPQHFSLTIFISS